MNKPAAFRPRGIPGAAVAAAIGAAAQSPLVAGAGPAGRSEEAPGAPVPTFIRWRGVVGAVYEVPLDLVVSNPVPPRAFYKPSTVDAIGGQLASAGQITPATGFLNADGGVTLLDGETRLRGARAYGLPTLRVEIQVEPKDQRAIFIQARAANVDRNQQTALDDAIRFHEMLSAGIFSTQTEISEALGIGKDEVSRKVKIAQMPSQLLVVLSEVPELLTLKMLTALREFCDEAGEDRTLALIVEVKEKGLGYRDVVARRLAAARGPVARPRAASEAVAFRGGRGELKSFEKDGRVEFVIKGLAEGDRQELVAQLKQLLPAATI